MSFMKWAIALVAIAVAGAIGIEVVGLPVIRSSEYRALIGEYSKAQPKQPEPRGEYVPEWEFDLSPAPDVTVRVHARKFMDVVTLHYLDEPAPRVLYEYEDYSSPMAIRTAPGRLFVYWQETLIHTDYWLLAYDLQNRREIQRLRVDRRDIEGQTP